MKAKMFLILALALLLALMPLSVIGAAVPPLLPFDYTSNLFVLDSGSGNILRITPDGTVTIAVTVAEIIAVTGANVTFDSKGIALDGAGTMYFVENTTDHILKRAPGETVTILATDAALEAAVGGNVDADGLAFGSDGFLYVADDSGNRVLRVNPSTGAATVYTTKAAFESLGGITTADLEVGIVGAEEGIIYTLSEDTPNAIFAIAMGGTPSVLASGAPFNDLDVFMTRAANGDLIIADNSGADTIFRVTPAGVVSTFLSEAQLEAVTGADVDLEGGIAFDSSGNFYVAEESSDSILKFDTTLTGSIWISSAAIEGVTGSDADLEGGIAFAPVPTPPVGGEAYPVNKLNILAPWLGLVLFLTIGGGVLLVRRRRAS